MDDNNSSIKRSKEEEKQEEEKAEQDEHSVKDSDRKEGSEKSSLYKMLSVIKSLGPGLIAGAADEDPSTIGTYSQAGAQFGLGMLWLALFQYPLIATVQEMCARIGLVTGSGLAAVIKKKYSRKVVLTVSSLILIANTINIGADIGAMAASLKLLVPQLPVVIATLSFTAFIVVSQMFVPYHFYVKILKYLTISLFAYVATAVIVGGNLERLLAEP